MSGFIPLKRSCPVCNGARKDCRQSRSTEFIHCRYPDAKPLGFTFIGEDALGFAMWAESSKLETASAEKQDRWRKQRQIESQQRLQLERQQRAILLSVNERDREIRKLLAQLGLTIAHREDLQRRGLTDEQIQAGQFRSVERWQRLEIEISHRLAGVNITGRGLTNADPGYFCPIWNPAGQILGWQLRLDNGDEGKYRWPTSATHKRPNGPTAHLQNGELPLTCCRPVDGVNRLGVGFAEGILKPWITAQLLGQIVLGAAGGNFSSSPQTLKAYLDELQETLCILYPDAGATSNPSIMRRYRQLHDLLKGWGYELRVAWWHQLSKDCPDIDELLAAGRAADIEMITWAQFETIAHHRNQLWQGASEFFATLKQRLLNSATAPPELSLPQAAPRPLPSLINYQPGYLPTPAEYEALGCPHIRFTDGQRFQLWREAVSKGWQHILDRSAPGHGKSHAAGSTHPDAMGVDKLWYFSSTHRNPTTGVIEGHYKDLPVRHNGLKRDSTHQTPLGRDWVVWPLPGEQPNIPGNCHRTQLFTLLREKNIRGVESAETSPICKTCHLKDACKSHVGNGFGFRDLRREALTSPRLRAHPDSAPSPIEYPYLESGFFWDEAATLIQSMESVTAELADFEQQWGELESVLPDLHEALTPLRVELRSLFRGEVNIPRYGFDDAAVRSFLPPPPDNLQGIIAEIENQLRPDFSQLKEPDNVDSAQLRGVSWATRQVIRAGLRRESYQDAASQFQALCLNWLVPFLKVWGGQPGALRFDRGQLTIFSRSTRHRDLAAATRFNLYLDATAQPEYLALSVGINPNQMLVIEQEPPNYSNLRIVQVSGMGLLGKDRSGSMQERVLELKHELSNRHPGIKFIDWKNQAFEGEGHWFVDSRGVNDFQGVPALASFGIPFQNLGYQQALYQTLTGRYVSLDKHHPDPEFQRFLDTRVQAEIIQMAGRLRTHLRPTEQLTYYFVGDYDLTFLRQAMPGVVIESVEAVNITPLAGDAHQQNWWKIITAISKLREQQQKVTQTAVAKLSGVVQSTISWLAAGSWKKIIEIATSSLNSSFDKILRQLDEQGRFTAAELAEQVLTLWADLPPEELLTELRTVEKVYGKRIFYAALALAPPPVQANLLAAVLGVLPPEWQREIEAITFGDTPLGSVALQRTFTPL